MNQRFGRLSKVCASRVHIGYSMVTHAEVTLSFVEETYPLQTISLEETAVSPQDHRIVLYNLAEIIFGYVYYK